MCDVGDPKVGNVNVLLLRQKMYPGSCSHKKANLEHNDLNHRHRNRQIPRKIKIPCPRFILSTMPKLISQCAIQSSPGAINAIISPQRNMQATYEKVPKNVHCSNNTGQQAISP